jgi:predicted nuclease of predicted toxin-antitoxin system
MRLLADLNISPRTVAFLRSLGHDVIRVNEILLATASDIAIIKKAIEERRTVVTQDLDFTAIVSLSGKNVPSVITLRLSSSRVEKVNAILQQILPTIEKAVTDGAVITVQDTNIRRRLLPLA